MMTIWVARYTQDAPVDVVVTSSADLAETFSLERLLVSSSTDPRQVVVHLEELDFRWVDHTDLWRDWTNSRLPELLERLLRLPHVYATNAVVGLRHPVEELVPRRRSAR
jgi:hypothetical protein